MILDSITSPHSVHIKSPDAWSSTIAVCLAHFAQICVNFFTSCVDGLGAWFVAVVTARAFACMPSRVVERDA
jgi:hypothetical protein